MSDLNGDDLIQKISSITLLFTDKEIKKHFSPDSSDVFRKCGDRIEEVYKRDKKNEEIKDKQ